MYKQDPERQPNGNFRTIVVFMERVKSIHSDARICSVSEKSSSVSGRQEDDVERRFEDNAKWHYMNVKEPVQYFDNEEGEEKEMLVMIFFILYYDLFKL